MNREFNPTSKSLRIAFAAAAAFATLLIAGSIGGLVDHYNGALALAATQQTVVARR